MTAESFEETAHRYPQGFSVDLMRFEDDGGQSANYTTPATPAQPTVQPTAEVQPLADPNLDQQLAQFESEGGPSRD